jgi:hypothetical protein
MIKSAMPLTEIEHHALKLAEVAKTLSCSKRFLEKQVAAGRLRVIKLSQRCVHVRPPDLADYLERNAV